MDIDPLAKAASLRLEASSVLQAISFPEWTEQWGTIEVAGSYRYDLMSWRDLDCTVRLKPGKDPAQALWEWVRLAQQRLPWRKFNFQQFTDDYKPWWPRGVYLGVLLEGEGLEGEWKIDLWALNAKDQQDADERNAEIERRLTPELRTLILEMKNELMGSGTRVPRGGSLGLYEAVLWEGLRERDAIFSYLSGRGVELRGCGQPPGDGG
jgi:hypothetical protein